MVLPVTLYLVKVVKCSVASPKVKTTNWCSLFPPLYFFICWDPKRCLDMFANALLELQSALGNNACCYLIE